MPAPAALFQIPGLGKHPVNEDTIAPGWIVYENMGYRADQPSVLDDRATAHRCVQGWTTL